MLALAYSTFSLEVIHSWSRGMPDAVTAAAMVGWLP
jgi:hypothetical protein